MGVIVGTMAGASLGRRAAGRIKGVLPMVIGGTGTLVLGRIFYDRDAAKVLAAARTTAGD